MTDADSFEDTVLAERTRKAARRASMPAHVAPIAPAPAENAPNAVADTYPARTAAPAIADRTPPPGRVLQAPVDGHRTASVRRRAGRRTALIVVVSASALAVIAAASLLLIALSPW